MPGRVAPVTLICSVTDFKPSVLICGYSKEARNQVLGTRIPRCISLANMALPVALNAPEMAQELEPGRWSPWYLFSILLTNSVLLVNLVSLLLSMLTLYAEGQAPVGIGDGGN